MKNLISDPVQVMVWGMVAVTVVFFLAIMGLVLQPVFDGVGGLFAPRLAACGIDQMYVGDKVGMPDGDYVITSRSWLKSIGVVNLTATKIEY